jgi:hypothetical protein
MKNQFLIILFFLGFITSVYADENKFHKNIVNVFNRISNFINNEIEATKQYQSEQWGEITSRTSKGFKLVQKKYEKSNLSGLSGFFSNFPKRDSN